MQASEIHELKERQKQYFASHQTLPLVVRKEALKKLRTAIRLHEDDIKAALNLDLGKSAKEAYFSEIGMVYSEISYMLRNLDRLAGRHPVLTPLHQFYSSSYTIDIPYGNVLIMSPWNYPFLLTMQPLVDCLAAGNTALVKPSAYSPATSLVIAELISENFIPDYISVIQGGRAENQALLEEEFDYIFFTGSKAVGHLVMEKASKYLTPITLELGGKSPVIVDESANLPLAAKRIVFGKFMNAGQTCVAPDYVYVHKSVEDRFLALLKEEIRKQYSDPAKIGKIINEKHFNRLKGLVDQNKVIYGGRASEATLQIEPTIMAGVTWSDPVMQEEIFGPILPVLVYEDFKETMDLIASKPTPLAFYLFSHNTMHIEDWQFAAPFGGGCLNDTVIQLANDHLPFGGMGASGMGQDHGKYGFACFSHTKGLLDKKEWIDLPMRYHNRNSKLDNWLIRLFLR